jgi:hypothetical protein
MPAVAINTNYVYIPEILKDGFLSEGFNGSFGIESTQRNLPLSVGDELLIIKKLDNDLIFTNAGKISNVGKRELVITDRQRKTNYNSNNPLYRYNFDFHVDKKLIKNNLLSELEYSLPVVENYNKPETHFQQQFRNMPDKDYETVVNGWVYASRTVFGKLINALPRQNKLEFMIQAMDYFSTIDFRNTSILEGLEFLYSYIERRILSRGRILVATDSIINKELNGLLPSNAVGFIDPDTKRIQNISTQAKIFKNLFDLEHEKSLKTSLNDTIQSNKDIEDRFKKLFNRRPWPVDLER